jgi:hypothetical protein
LFTIFLDKQAALFKQLLEKFVPWNGSGPFPRGIDFTSGTKATWWDLIEKVCPHCKQMHYDIVWCDQDPLYLHETELRAEYYKDEFVKLRRSKNWKKQPGEDKVDYIHRLQIETNRRVEKRVNRSIDPLRDILQRDLFQDSYEDLGQFDFGFADFPYLIGRSSFDYPSKQKVMSHSQGMYGPRSWGSTKLETYVANPDVATFNRRVQILNEKAAAIIKPGGLLFIKIMNPRHKKKLINHDVTFINELGHFVCEDRGVYIRQGATTWSTEDHLQNLNGFWLVFRKSNNFSIQAKALGTNEVQSKHSRTQSDRAEVDHDDGQLQRDGGPRNRQDSEKAPGRPAARNDQRGRRDSDDRGQTAKIKSGHDARRKNTGRDRDTLRGWTEVIVRRRVGESGEGTRGPKGIEKEKEEGKEPEGTGTPPRDAAASSKG